MAVGEVTSAFETTVDFGMQVFPFPNECEPGHVTLDVGSNSSAAVMAALGEPPPSAGNWTPMAQTLETIGGYGPMLDAARDRHVILITDGWQWCSPYDPDTRFTPVSAVESLRALGITVHVVGFGASVDPLTLNRAAVAAGTALPGCDPTLEDPAEMNHCYSQANDLDALRVALADIARSITAEVCDGFDNDCNGTIDDGFDVDLDTYTLCGSDLTRPGVMDPGLVDCVDSDPRIHPTAAEICDGLDNDCDGSADPGCDCLEGATQSCGIETGACASGTQTCAAGAWGDCEGALEAGAEECNGSDDDCDGVIDDDVDCGAGRGCVDGECVDLMEPVAPPADPPPAEDIPQEGGCGCVAAGVSPRAPADWRAALLAVLGLGIAFVVRRRVR
jgi:MYXO-CTERM domain-containing protein